MSSPLTDRQFLKIKELRLQGMSYEKIAKQMKMSRNTVTFHAKSDITPSQRQQAHPANWLQIRCVSRSPRNNHNSILKNVSRYASICAHKCRSAGIPQCT